MTVTREILSLPLEDIAIGERVGFYHTTHAESLAIHMGEDGQSDPIHVRRNGNAAKKPWTLVAGRHRIGAAEILGWSHIDAIQVADAHADADILLRLELSENLDHRNPRPIERAIFIAARARLEEAVDHPGHVGERSQDRAIRLRWEQEQGTISGHNYNELDTPATMADASDWRERTAIAFGCSLRSLERYNRIYQAIAPFEDEAELIEALNAHPLGESLTAMTRLAQIDRPDTRRKVIEAVIADRDIPSVDEAMVRLGLSTSKGSRPLPQDRLHVRVMNGWNAMRLAEKRSAAVELAETMPPTVADAVIETFKKRGFC